MPATARPCATGSRAEHLVLASGVVAGPAEHGCHARDVLRVERFLSAPEHFAAWNTAWTEVFPQDPPARTTVVSRPVAPEHLLEAQAIAVLPREAR